LLILEELCRNSLHLFDKAGFRYYPCENKSLTQERAQRTQENRKQREDQNVKRTKGARLSALSYFNGSKLEEVDVALEVKLDLLGSQRHRWNAVCLRP
jgi:O6-methylguanine-DNA--protein-cysteine methyltransferase